MRRALVVIHRWLGLFSAIFLFIAGVTGAVIAWDHELDAWLNPAFYEARSPATQQDRSTLDLADQLEQRDPRLRVRYLPLSIEPGETLRVNVAPRIDPRTQKPFALDFDQVALDPRTGEIQARRLWGEASLRRENLLPFLYKLHYSLHIPPAFDVAWGTLLMGVVALVWVLDTLIALWISFPNRKAWRKSFAFRLRAGGYRLLFDLHRSGGVWAWGLLLTLAITAVSMNLGRQVVRPVVSLFSTLTPSPFDEPAPHTPDDPAEPSVTREQVLANAQREAQRRGHLAPPGGLFYSPEFGIYGVGFFAPGREHGDGGLGNSWLLFDGGDGRPAGAQLPGQGSAGDLFMQAQFPLHSGRILGTPGRALVSFLGLVVALLSVTGVVIWARKRRARVHSARHKQAAAAASPSPAPAPYLTGPVAREHQR